MNRDLFYDFKLKLFDWLDEALKNSSPDNVVALCFNLYECEACNWKLELIGTDKYNENEDWACDEVFDFSTRENPFVWQETPRSNWEFVKDKVFLALYEYLKCGKYNEILFSKKCVALGYVDGDLTVIHTKKKQKFFVSKYLIFSLLTLILLIGFYLVDVFVLNIGFEIDLIKFIILCVSIVLFYLKLANNEKKIYATIENTNYEEIGFAFRYDKKSKVNLLKAIKYFHNGNYFKCIKKLNKLYDKTENLADRQAVEIFAALTCEKIDSIDDAIKGYEAVLRENPLNITALNNLAAIYSKRENYDKAIHYATTAVNAANEPIAYTALATAYFKSFDLEKAKVYAEIALELNPNLVQAINVLAMAYTLEKDERAEEYIDLALKNGAKKIKITTAIDFYKEEYGKFEKKQKKVNELLDKWCEATKTKTISVTLTNNTCKSVLGGKINEEAPISKNGLQMKLLAAVFCSELSENTLMPKKGVIRFYIAPDEYYGADFDYFNLNIQNNFKVLYDENEDKFITALDEEFNVDFPVLRSSYLSFEAVDTCMTLSDYRYEKTLKSIFTDDIDEDVIEDFETKINVFKHQILGYPSFTQEDPREDFKFEKYDTLLFQLASECDTGDEIMIGDSGIMQFFIPNEKLKNCDFSDVLYTWDCY